MKVAQHNENKHKGDTGRAKYSIVLIPPEDKDEGMDIIKAGDIIGLACLMSADDPVVSLKHFGLNTKEITAIDGIAGVLHCRDMAYLLLLLGQSDCTFEESMARNKENVNATIQVEEDYKRDLEQTAVVHGANILLSFCVVKSFR